LAFFAILWIGMVAISHEEGGVFKFEYEWANPDIPDYMTNVGYLVEITILGTESKIIYQFVEYSGGTITDAVIEIPIGYRDRFFYFDVTAIVKDRGTYRFSKTSIPSVPSQYRKVE